MAIHLLSISASGRFDDSMAMKAALEGFRIELARSPLEGLSMLRGSRYDVALAFFPLEDWEPSEYLEEIQRAEPGLPVVVVDPSLSLAGAVSLARQGVFQVLEPGCQPGELSRLLRAAAVDFRARRQPVSGCGCSTEPWRRLIVGESRAMQTVFDVIRLVGARRSTVLINGETGTGKEVVARAIHMASSRSHRPLVAVNCSALPENLLEAELFGHVRGAFTGAMTNRIGRFEQAHQSTIFLDEVSEMPLELQAKLLRVLQEREFQRLGSSETVKVDVRVIAATNANLAERVREGKFREDLYYRLNVVPLPLPPLRERLRDIPLLVCHFVDKICRQEDLPLRRVSPEALARLQQYDWPGNVRQLENAVEMAVALSGERSILYPSDFPRPSQGEVRGAPETGPSIAVPDDGLDFEETVGRIERAILEQAMRKTGGNKKQAAEMLGLKRTTFAAKLKGLDSRSNCPEREASAAAGHCG